MANSKHSGTAGRILSESSIRAYSKCSQFHAFGGSYEGDIRLQIIKQAFEKVAAVHLRKDLKDPAFILGRTAQEGARALGAFDSLMEPQAQALVRECVLLTNEALSKFPIQEYLPITGPLPFRVQLSKTPIDLSVSACFRSKKRKTIHYIDFTPYSSKHAIRWDIPTHLKIKYLSKFVPTHNFRKVKVVGHIFGLSEKGTTLAYTSMQDTDVDKKLLRKAESLIKNMERGYHMPLVPCPYSCVFKKRCQP